MKQHSSFQRFLQNLLFSTKTVRFVIIFSFFTLMSGALFAIIFFVYSQFISKISELANQQVDVIAERTFQQTKNFINPLADIIKTIGWDVQDKDLFSSEKNITAIRAIDLFKALPQISSFTIGSENGDAITINPVSKGTPYAFQAYKTLPENAKFLSNRIDREKEYVQETYEYYDEFAQKIHSESRTIQSKGTLPDETKNDSYDPRTRPWYTAAKKAGKTTWSDIYTSIYAGFGRLLTVSNPIMDRSKQLLGVVAAGIKLKNLAQFLKNQILYPLETIFLFDQKGEVIAYASRSETFPNDGQDDEKMFVKDITDLKIGEIYKIYLQTNEKKIIYSADSDDLDDIAYFFSLNEVIGKDWGLCIVINGKNLLGAVQGIRQKAILFSCIIIALTLLLIILLSKRITAPIQSVAKILKNLQRLNFKDIPSIHSRFSDIQEMGTALEGVVSALRSFEKFVPKFLILKILQTKKEVVVEGEEKEATVLFTDIQDFTTISEQIPKVQLASYLFDYFEEMTLIIKKNSGILDKYIGDAIMAFWEASPKEHLHVHQACRTVLACLHHLEVLNKKWEEDKKPVLKTRFGISTGKVLVCNTGSSDRLQHTLLGDFVNLGARLEGANKVYGTKILVNHNTYQAGREKFIFRPVDLIAVKGQKAVGQIYELLAEYAEGDVENNILDISALAVKTATAYEAYRHHNWQQALELYQKIHTEFPEDKLAQVFIQRCETFIETPPDAKWDGVFRMGGV